MEWPKKQFKKSYDNKNHNRSLRKFTLPEDELNIHEKRIIFCRRKMTASISYREHLFGLNLFMRQTWQ